MLALCVMGRKIPCFSLQVTFLSFLILSLLNSPDSMSVDNGLKVDENEEPGVAISFLHFTRP